MEDVEAVFPDEMLNIGIIAQRQHGAFAIATDHHLDHRAPPINAVEHAALEQWFLDVPARFEPPS
jgi:hypothetical protein